MEIECFTLSECVGRRIELFHGSASFQFDKYVFAIWL
jgi:hypothetical protein